MGDLSDIYTSKGYVIESKDTDFAKTIIGDPKAGEFVPRLQIGRWDDEVVLAVRPNWTIPSLVTPEFSEDKILWGKGQDIEINIYPAGEFKEDGGVEYDVIVNSRPSKDYIELIIEHKGLEFLFQPELTQDEIDNNYYRPDDIIKSYAVYHNERGGFDGIGIKNKYKVGKVCHIRRPLLIDSVGQKQWGDLSIEPNKISQGVGILKVSSSTSFWDKAVYPVKKATGTDFGYTSVGGSDGSTTAAYLEYSYAYSTPASDGALDSVSVYCKAASGTASLIPALYTNATSPYAFSRLAYVSRSGSGSSISTSYAWVTTNLSYASITSGTRYRIGYCVKVGEPNISIKYDSGGVTCNEGYQAIGSGDWPATAGSMGCDTYIFSVYATYTPAASALASLLGGKLVNYGVLANLRGN